jgi:hypothetical protein
MTSEYDPSHGFSHMRARLNEKFDINEEAPTNAIGTGNIAGINPPAGPAPLTDRNLRGLAADLKPRDLARKHGVPLAAILQQLAMGSRVEREHTDNAATAMKIAMDHVFEDPKYYTKLKKIESGNSKGRDIGNDTIFKRGANRETPYRTMIGQTRRTTDAHPGNPGIEHA